jgi:hypothetical protein
MSFVVLFSTMSFTIDLHYCGDTLVETAIFHKAKGCGMEMDALPANSECSVVKKGCCSEEQIAIQGQDELQLSIDKFNFEKQLFVTTFVYAYIQLFEGVEDDVTSYEDYPPPVVKRQIYKLDETYLI